jgi:outer membrane protein assembly factor BamD
MRRIIFFIANILLLSSCSEYSKILKNPDSDFRYEKAVEYFDKGVYTKCFPLFEDLIAVNRGTKRSEQVYFYYAHTQYFLEEYVMAGYYFKNFAKTFPNSAYTEKSLFLSAMCSYKQSPVYSLDQAATKEAINDFQLFLNRYPKTERKDSTQALMDQLNEKLELKAFENAKQYWKIEKYKGAVIALNNTIKDYPNSIYEQEMHFLIVKSSFELAINSIEEKKKERLMETIKAYYTFVDRFAESEWIKEAENIFVRTNKELQQFN